MFKRTLTLLAITALLIGCARAVDMTGPAKAAYTAKATYAAALVVAAEYVRLPRCERPPAPTLCSRQAVVDQIRKADLAADAATQAAENAVRNLGSDPSVVSAAVEAATQAVSAFKLITTTYGVK